MSFVFCLYDSVMHGIFYYSTISWNTRLVGEALQGFLKNAGVTLDLQDLVLNNSLEIQSTKDKVQNDGIDFIMFACGTYGHGQLEKTMRKCMEETWKDVKLNWIPCAAIGLGDHRYDLEYNMYAGVLLENWIGEHGGELIYPALRINRSPLKPNNQKIMENWAWIFCQKIQGKSWKNQST